MPKYKHNTLNLFGLVEIALTSFLNEKRRGKKKPRLKKMCVIYNLQAHFTNHS